MLEQQMELFEDGGLKDEGGEVDEVSGNEVPIGGTKKGVRDDVPAMVSEGEFVFPEDVTRYIGLDKLMQMRQEAKMGLKRMEAMGQMGNGDEATMPDDLPFGVADLIVVAGDTGEELEMQEGGFVVRPTTATRTEQQPTYVQPPVERPPEFRSTRALTPTIERPARSDIDFSKIMGDANIELKEYRNEEGKTILIPFISGSPIFPVPDGYILYTGEDSSANTNEVASKINEMSKEKDTYEVPDFLKPQPPEPKNWATMSTDELIDELGSVTGTARLLTKGAMLLMGPVGLAGNLMMSHQDKKIVAAIDAALAKGGLSSEDKATLTAAKEELTKSGMLSFLDPIVDGVANVLGVPKEQVNESVSANVESGAVTAEEPEVVAADPYAGDVVKTDVRTRDPRIGGGVPDTYISDGPSGPATAEATFGAPLGDPLGGTPPPVDELVFTPTPQQLQTDFDTLVTPDGAVTKGEVEQSLPQTYTSTGAQMQASQKALEDIGPILPDPANVLVLSQPEPAPVTTGRGYDTSLGQDFSSYAVTPEQIAYSTSPTKRSVDYSTLPSSVGQKEDPYDPRTIMPVTEQVIRAQPVATRAQTQAPSMSMPDAFVESLPVPSRQTSERPFIPPMTTTPPLIGSTQMDTDTLAPTLDTTGGAQIKTDRGYVPTNVAKRAAKAQTVKPVGEVTTDRGYVPTNEAKRAVKVDYGDYADPRGREQLPSVKQKLSSLRPKAKPETVETTDGAKAKKDKKKAPPKRDTGSKSNRLDKSNPNTEINFNEHLAEWEKDMARGNPALAQHFIATANRRQNDIEKTGKDPEDKISAKKTDESGGLGGWIKKQFGKKKGGLATRY